MPTLLSVISDHNIPNLLVAKHYQPERHIFLTTQQMQQRAKHLKKALNLSSKNLISINIPDEDFKGIQDVLAAHISKINNFPIIINLTGGTKLMALSIYDFFTNLVSTNHENVKFVYLPINSNEIIIINGHKREKLTSKIETVVEYLHTYGIDILCHRDPAQKDHVFAIFKTKQKQQFPPIVNQITHDYLNRGEWFEDYLYWKIKSDMQLDNSHIKCGVKIRLDEDSSHLIPHYNDNEIDVLFVFKNNLYIVEAKTRMKKDFQTQVYYKLASFYLNMGLSAKTYLCHLSQQPISDLHGKMIEILKNRLSYQDNSHKSELQNIYIEQFKRKSLKISGIFDKNFFLDPNHSFAGKF